MEIDLNELQCKTINELDKDLIYIQDIDEGAFGKVILVKDSNLKKEFAIKIIKKRETDYNIINKIKQEISILKRINHENIVKYYGYKETQKQLLIKMEYIKYGTLKKWMRNNKNISEEQASMILKKILSAISYLHSKQICHRDIKPGNIMLSKEDNLDSIKIIDFGLSSQNFDSLNNSEYCGTFIYMAPEQIEKKSYYLSVDIWSIGILMYMLLNNGQHPFYHKGDSKEDFINNLKECKELTFNNKISYMAKDLLKKLLEWNPLKRYKANDALKHPWITRNIEDKIPKTFNEQLKNDTILNKTRELIMISIFLNYIQKNHILFHKIKKKNKIKLIEIKNPKSNIFRIDKNYIKRCEYISNVEKGKLKELKFKGLDIISTEDESNEKNENKNNPNNKLNGGISSIYKLLNSNYNEDAYKEKIYKVISKIKSKKSIKLLYNHKVNNEKKDFKNLSAPRIPGKNLFITNLHLDNNCTNYLLPYKSSAKKLNYNNKINDNSKIDNIFQFKNNQEQEDSYIKIFNYYKNKLNKIKPQNLFLRNNHSQILFKKYCIKKKFLSVSLNKNIEDRGKIPLKFPKVNLNQFTKANIHNKSLY